MSESIHIFSYKICLQFLRLCAYHVQIIMWEVLKLMLNFLIISNNPFLYITTIWQSHQHIFFKLKRTVSFFPWMTSEMLQKSKLTMCSTPFLSKLNGNSNIVIPRVVINQNNQILDMRNKRVCIILEILFTDIVQPISGHSRD